LVTGPGLGTAWGAGTGGKEVCAQTGMANETASNALAKLSTEGFLTRLLGADGYMLLGAAFFIGMAVILYRIALKKDKVV